jgi:hypothetical protein
MKYDTETERGFLASVREARADLLTLPIGKLTAEDTTSAVPGTWLCIGCDQPIKTPSAFIDEAGWLWCRRCAASDVIAGAFTRAEALELLNWIGEHAAAFADRAARSTGSARKSYRAAGDDCGVISLDLLNAWTAAGDSPVPVAALFGSL